MLSVMRASRPTMYAYLKHYWGPVHSFSNRVASALLYAAWPITTFLLRLLHQPRGLRNAESRVGMAYILHAFPPPSNDPGYLEPNVNDFIIDWLQEVLPGNSVTVVFEIDEIEDLKPDPRRSVIVPTYQWLLPFSLQPLHRQLRQALRIKRTGLPVWGMLVDLFVPHHALATSILVALTGGAHPMTCNSVQSANRYGIPNPVEYFFWSRPELSEKFKTVPRWKDRELAVLASMSGEPKRREVLEPLIPKVEASGYTFVSSHPSNRTYEGYLTLLAGSRVMLAPTFLHQHLRRGPARYQKRLSPSIITGRVWETFASGCALLTTYNQDLQDLGFKAGTHYLQLPIEVWEIEQWSWPDDLLLESVAHAGRELYFRLAAEEKGRRLYIS